MSVSLWSRVGPQNTTAIREGLRMARKVFANEHLSATGLTTSELYQLMLKEKPVEEFRPYDVKKNVLGAHWKLSAPGSKKTVPPLPPHPEHPIRSMSFLKQQVLPIMEGNKEIRLATATRIPTIVVEDVREGQSKNKGKSKPAASVAAAEAPSPVLVRLWKPITQPIPKMQDPNFGKDLKPEGHEVGVGEDWGHLNKRRKRKRLVMVKKEYRFLATTRKQQAMEAFRKEREEYDALKDRQWQKRMEKDKLRWQRRQSRLGLL
ncbi:hypothetical protein D9758_009346 [Tetrapyrgos nigripes]|uniref:T-box domain-containing protein n=1 Tax=Tetrapyrgos nigripes TaxID=182062 RepID=A0A8H5GH07_9AGAR|nr:hypothetical protein D9758_009346 [Tetrapyrgos nigripes]